MDKGINDRFIKGMNHCIFIKAKGCKDQKTFCKLMGMHQPKITQIKTYFVYPTIEQVAKLATVFGISATWVLTGIEPKLINKK